MTTKQCRGCGKRLRVYDWCPPCMKQEHRRMNRENGSLARMYSLCEATLRERTEENNRLEEQANRMAGTLHVCTEEIERLRMALTDAAAEWHAASCEVDAGGGCILHADEKKAWIAAKLDSDKARYVYQTHSSTRRQTSTR